MTKSGKHNVSKGEIARFEQFLLLSLIVFKKLSAAEASESVYMRERVKVNVTFSLEFKVS